MTGFCGLPERVCDLAELHDDGDAVFYAPAADGAEGFVLTDRARADLGAIEAERAAKMAEADERLAAKQAALAGLIIKRAARDALLEAGADVGLIDGVVAHFMKEVPLVVGPDETVTVADGLAGVVFAAGSWLDAKTPKYRGRRHVHHDAGEGRFTAQLRALLQ